MSKLRDIVIILVCVFASLKLCMDIKHNFEDIKAMQAYQSLALTQILTLQKTENKE